MGALVAEKDYKSLSFKNGLQLWRTKNPQLSEEGGIPFFQLGILTPYTGSLRQYYNHSFSSIIPHNGNLSFSIDYAFPKGASAEDYNTNIIGVMDKITESILVTKMSTTTADLNVGWKTFQDEKCAFEFRYPATWEVRQGTSGIILTKPTKTGDKGDYWLSIGEIDSGKSLMTKDLLVFAKNNSVHDYFEDTLQTDFSINGRATVRGFSEGTPQSPAIIDTFMVSNGDQGKVFQFGCLMYTKISDTDSTCNKILKSFRFPN